MHQIMLMGLLVGAAVAEFRAGGPEYQSETVTCHLPEREHLANSVGRDGLGLCVFTSIDLAARWANEPGLVGFRDFMKSHPGGGWPEKVDEYIPKMAAHNKRPAPNYLQHTGGDPEFLKSALRTGRYVSVTYDGRDGAYYRTRIAHMVNLVHFSDRHAVIQDNNFPGKWLWMSPAAFVDRWRGTGGGWAVVLLNPGPPPIPVNRVAPNPSTSEHPLIIQGDEPNFGLDLGRIDAAAKYQLNGREITRDQALTALGELPDDSNRLRLTIVGDAAFRERVRADLASHPALLALKDRLLTQDYPPDHWAVADVGFAGGLTLQPPAGKDGKAPVLWRMTQYPGPDALAGAIRKADPLYQPSRDPDPTKTDPAKPDAGPLAEWANWSNTLWLGLGIGAMFLARRLGLKLPGGKPAPDDLRELIRAILTDLLKPAPPPPAPAISDEELRKRIQEVMGRQV